MREDMLDFIKFELLDMKGLIEYKVERIPLDQRKPIYKRIKKINEAIRMIELCNLAKERVDK